MKRINGFTLIELIITMLALSILIVIGVPSYTKFFSQQALTQQTEKVYHFMRLANSEAIKQNQKMYVHFCKSDTSEEWRMAMTKQASCNCFAANSCLLTDVDDTNGREVIEVLADGKKVKLTTLVNAEDDDIRFIGDQVSYSPMRFSVNAGSITLTDLNESKLKIIQSISRLKICSPGSAKLGYSAC